MEPRDPSFLDELEPEEPLEADDYYDAMQMGWLSSGGDEDLEQDLNPAEPPTE